MSDDFEPLQQEEHVLKQTDMSPNKQHNPPHNKVATQKRAVHLKFVQAFCLENRSAETCLFESGTALLKNEASL